MTTALFMLRCVQLGLDIADLDLLTIGLVLWSLTNCWTRLYLGVHYPGDITVGLCWGALVGYTVYRLYCRVTKPVAYNVVLLYVPMAILLLTILCAFVQAGIRVASGA